MDLTKFGYYQLGMSLGEYGALEQDGIRPVTIYGYNGGITGANRETVWNTGGVYAFPPAAAGMEVVSDSTDDDGDPAGTGALTVKISYLNGSYVEDTTTVTMNGTGVVATSDLDILRIQDFRVATVGTGGVAAGNIIVRELDNAPTFATIAAGTLQAFNGVYTVPDGYDLMITEISTNSSAAATKGYLDFTLFANYNSYTRAATTSFHQMWNEAVNIDGHVHKFGTPLKFPEHTDMYLSVIGDAATDAALATGVMRGVLLPQ